MAPTNRSKPREVSPILRRVQSGRIGEPASNRKHYNDSRGKELLAPTQNKGKELFPGTSNASKELFPKVSPELPSARKNANKELFPEVSLELSSKASVPLSIAANESPTTIPKSRSIRSLSDSATSSKLTFKRSRKPHKSRTPSAIQALNLEQRRAKQARDSTTRRLQALHFDPSHRVDDAGDAKTTPYAAARLDLKADTSPTKSKKLKFPVAVGFWGYEPIFTPIKVFSLSTERFSDAQGLSRLIFANTDVQKAIAEVGVNVSPLALVGYEMLYPKGCRYVQGDAIDRVRGCATPFKTVPSNRHVLVNTNCALQEFFWHAEHYASDEEENVLIQVIARVALTQTQPIGEIVYKMLDSNWRNNEEKQWEAEKKRQHLEKQSFAGGAEKTALKERMKAIEEKTQRAMENARARKELKEADLGLSQLVLDSGTTSQLRSSETEVRDGGMGDDDSKIESDLDTEIY